MPITLRINGKDHNLRVDPRNLPFAQQYPLWSDGADKRRWIYLPPGTTIDASNPESWNFPVGTKLWKEFSWGGQRVETRMLQRIRTGWSYATYVWNEAGERGRASGSRPVRPNAARSSREWRRACP